MNSKYLDNFNNIAVIGLGRSGLSALRLLTYLNKPVIAINSGEKSSWYKNVSSLIKEDKCFEQSSASLNDIDLVVLSPGIPRDIDLLKKFDGPIICEIELAYHFCDSPIISITGTNGKTTTVSLLEKCLELSEKTFFVGGNIGTPFCDYAYELISGKREKASTVVLELSSFQLESLEHFHSKVASVLNITFSHGERYDDLESYARAKRNIFNNCDHSLWPTGLWKSVEIEKPEVSDAQIIDYSKAKEELKDFVDLEKIRIYGEHNIFNIYMAYKVWMSAGLLKKDFLKGLYEFNGVDYRLQFLGEFNGIKVFNDAKSTNWDALMTAIEAVADLGRVKLIIGGQKRGEGDDQLQRLDIYKSNIEEILFIGESGLELSQRDIGIKSKYIKSIDSISEYMDGADVLLFSPAFPSFDQFKNYVERGKSFTKLFN